MTNYRTTPLPLSTRLTRVTEMLIPFPQRQWGGVTQLSDAYHVSRTWLYERKRRASDALISTLSPLQRGLWPHQEKLVIDEAFVKRTITVLPLINASIRGIQQGLDLLLGIDRSMGEISQTRHHPAKAAETINTQMSLAPPLKAEADEIFAANCRCLTVVDGLSTLVLSLTPEQKRDATTFGLRFIELCEGGIEFAAMTSDGAKGIETGVAQSELKAPHRLDPFHLLKDAQTVTKRLERLAYQAIDAAERARRGLLEIQNKKRRIGCPLIVKAPLPQAEVKEMVAICIDDQFLW